MNAKNPKLEMDKARVDNFDRYAKDYSAIMKSTIGWMGQDHDIFLSSKARLLLRLLQRLGNPKNARVVDVGCGIGLLDRLLVGEVGALHGLDISEESVQIAAQGCPGAIFQHFDGCTMPYSSEAFDLAFAVCVVHHVPPAHRTQFASEMARVLRPGGLAVIIEHNPFNPITRLIVSRCEFDHDAVLLTPRTCRHLAREAGLEVVNQNFITFIPFRIPGAEQIEKCLGWLPLGAQYVIAAVKS